VYGRLNEKFAHPCDSRIVNIFQTNNRWRKMELLSPVLFKQKGIMCEVEGGEIIFMAILHTV
jgi:hypothetical protein